MQAKLNYCSLLRVMSLKLCIFFNVALRGKCRQEKDLEKFKTDYDIGERTSLEAG